MTTSSSISLSLRASFAALLACLSSGLVGCGDLDDVTTVKDLRVLAIKAEPSAFLVDLQDPGAGADTDWAATFTALVVDPTTGGEPVTVDILGCPNYLDTITAATGTGTRTCNTSPLGLPEPLASNLATVMPAVDPASVAPSPVDPITYGPSTKFGLTAGQVRFFFAEPATGVEVLDQALINNRTFGLDAIADFSFGRAGQTAQAVKRVVYWPRIDPSLIDGEQKPNKNPELTGISFFRSRNAETGDPDVPYEEAVPELSLARKDKLFVLPSTAEAEEYYFFQKDHEMNGAIVATKAKEYLRYAFFATAGTFSPAERYSELSPFFTSKDGKVHFDSEYNLPKAENIPADGQTVTVWVVVRDERAGVGWFTKKIRIVP